MDGTSTSLGFRLFGLGLCVALALLLGACSTHLAGTNDAELEYRVESDPATGHAVAATVAAAEVKCRLSAAQSMADVDALESGAVRVVVDADTAGAVDGLLAWRGGLDVHLVDRTLAKGSEEVVARAVRETKLDEGHLAFAARVADSDGAWEALVVTAPPRLTLGLGEAQLLSVDPALGGRAISLAFPAGAMDALTAAPAPGPGARVALVRGRTLLGTLPLERASTSPIVVSFGEDVLSYTRAYHARLLLGSCSLPPLRRTSAAPVPPRWGLAAACAALPCLLSLAWLAFVRRFDRARPEPLWLVMATFALGALSVLPAGLAEYAFAAASPWLDPSVVTLGGQLRALPLAMAVGTLVVGVSEEGAKMLAVLALAWRRREFDEPVDGIVYSSAAALGFAAAENAKYFAVGRMSGTVVAVRGFVTVPAHMFFAALWGYALGQTLVSRKNRVPEALALAAFAHGTFDALLSTDGAQLAATGLVLVLAATFVIVLRLALRHGPAPRAQASTDWPSADPAPASQMPRTSHRVGSPRAFYAFAGMMVVCAFGLTVLGTAYELLHHRVGPVFVTIACVVLALFGVAAYEASETLPLDVVLDARGITYSGVRMAWSTLRGVATTGRGRRWYVVVDSPEGSTRLGPTSENEASVVADAIRSALPVP